MKIYGVGRIQEEILRNEVKQLRSEGKAKIDEVTKTAEKLSTEAKNLYDYAIKLHNKIELEKEKKGAASEFMPELFKPTASKDVKGDVFNAAVISRYYEKNPLTDKQKEEINAQFDRDRNIDTAFPIMKKYIKDKYLHDKFEGNMEFIDTLKVFSKGKRTTLFEIDKLINKYGYTRLIQMFLRDMGSDNVIKKAHDHNTIDDAFKTLNKLKKPIRIQEEEEDKIA